MSQYENYNETAKNYDKTRQPIGVDIILETFERTPVPILKQHILDAGCGTGNYALAILRDVERVVAIDGNSAMLERAEAKLKASPFDNYELKRGTLPHLPIEDAAVDGVMINQVIHHLDTREEFPVLKVLCAECARTIKSGGHLIINTCSTTQLREAYWYGAFIPSAIENVVKRYPPVELLVSILQDSGFRNVRVTIPVEELFLGEAYFDLDGPLKAEWRDGDSLWALLSEAELRRSLEEYQTLRDAGELRRLLKSKERRRKQIGQSVFVSARKIPES